MSRSSACCSPLPHALSNWVTPSGEGAAIVLPPRDASTRTVGVDYTTCSECLIDLWSTKIFRIPLQFWLDFPALVVHERIEPRESLGGKNDDLDDCASALSSASRCRERNRDAPGKRSVDCRPACWYPSPVIEEE